MYKSSSMTFIYKYVFVPVWGSMFIFGIIESWNTNDPFAYNWSRNAALLVSWALVWLMIMAVRLRRVEATRENLVIKTFKGRMIVDYKDIEWVSQPALINPVMISLKYRDSGSGELKKILILPGMFSQMFRFNFLAELEMTKFIRERIMANNPEYSKELEPSRWLPVGLVFLSGLPLILLIDFFL